VGKGCPDLLVGSKGSNYLLEVKTKAGRIEPTQLVWHESWDGQVAVVKTPEQALRVVGLID
jgi:hypothetical protein